MSAAADPNSTPEVAMRADELLIETIEALLGDHCTPERIGAAEGGADAALWTLLEDSGLTLVGVPEARGGSGGSMHDSAAIVKAAGRHAAPVPIADTLVAASLAAAAGLDVPAGPLALAIDRPAWRSSEFPGAAARRTSSSSTTGALRSCPLDRWRLSAPGSTTRANRGSTWPPRRYVRIRHRPHPHPGSRRPVRSPPLR